MTQFLSQQLFPAILNMSLTAGVVILCVLAARLALRRAPKVFSYALWAVVLFRLLCPVSLSAGFSLLGVVDTPVRTTAPLTSRVEYVSPETIQQYAPWGESVPQTDVPAADQDVGQPAARPAAGNGGTEPALTAAAAAPWVWLAGVLGLMCYSLVSMLRLRRRLVGAVRLADNIYLADHIQTPFVLGLVRPRIYLPSALPEREMGYILLHEQYHIRHGDHIVKLLAFLALCLHWFNPLVWLAFVLAGKDMEMRCDEAVVRQLGDKVRADYSASLLTLATGRLSIAGTPLAFGEGDPKGRIRNLLRWKQPKLWLSLAAGAACVAIIAACAANPAGQNTPAASGGMEGQYESMEDFARQTMDRAKEVRYMTYTSGDMGEGGEATAQVTDTKIAWLDKQGEVPDLAPGGTLEAWTFNYLVQIDVPTEEVALVGGMYEEDGWFDLEGQGGHNIVALRYFDGSYDILYDEIVNDNSFLAYYNSYGEAICDWYVKETGLDLPLYVEDWTDKISYPDGDYHGNYPVHRYDGDGWYLYLPVSAWTQWGSGTDRWVWTSDYNTGSSITVEYIQTNLADYLEQDTQGMTPVEGSGRVFQAQGDGRSYRCYYWDTAAGYWKITIQWVDANITDYPYIAIEPQALQAMAESFTLDASITAARSTGSLLTGVTEGETQLTLTLTPEGGTPGDACTDCWGTANGSGYYSELMYLTWQSCSMPADGASLGSSVTLQGPSWTLTAYEGTPAAAYDDGSGTLWLVPDLSQAQSVYQLLRGWYDEAEFWALGGGYDQQDRIVIPDSGQDYLTAAAEFCTRLEEVHLQASPGSSFCWTYVQCLTEPAGDIPAFEDLPDNVHPFYLTTVFVPENQNALNQSMAGNTGDYTGDDPSVPEGAFEYGRCGFITLESDGWHGELVGTGW